jgi:hypothetical protein
MKKEMANKIRHEETIEGCLETLETTKLILLDSLLQEVVVTLPHLVLQKPSTAKMREAPTGAGTDTR